MASALGNAGGAHSCTADLQMQGYRRLLIATFLVTIQLHCIVTNGALAAPAQAAPAVPTQQKQSRVQNFTVFQQYEADALNAILKNWTEGNLNPQLTTFLNWSPAQHPCNISAMDQFFCLNNVMEFEGAWRGVLCSTVLQEGNATGNVFSVNVTTLRLFGSNSSCIDYLGSDFYIGTSFPQCGFEGVKGVLPSEISKLLNLNVLSIYHNPELTGPVPLEILQMPILMEIYVNYNNFSGADGTFFGAYSLKYLNVSFNQLEGAVDFQGVSVSTLLEQLDLRNNHFNGIFSSGPYLNTETLLLANNKFTGLRFANYTGLSPWPGSNTDPRPRYTCPFQQNCEFVIICANLTSEQCHKFPYRVPCVLSVLIKPQVLISPHVQRAFLLYDGEIELCST